MMDTGSNGMFISLVFALVVLAPRMAKSSPLKYELLDYEPTPDPAATVISSTDRLLRMEYTDVAGSFEDRATLAFVNRRTPVPKFTSSEASGLLTITTSSIKVSYKVGAAFSAASVSVVPTGPSDAFRGWDGGQRSESDPGNLLGTFRTLDRTAVVDLNCTAEQSGDATHVLEHCTYGLTSRSGWALVDDSDGPVLDSDDFWMDSKGRPYSRRGATDWYLFAHGHDYRGALKDYSIVGGRIPIVPRYAHGVWWTRWYDLAAQDVRKVLDDFSSRALPLDCLVLDMNWHTKQAWTGYSFDRNLFPFPADTLALLKGKGVALAANLHDAQGVQPFEDAYPVVAERMGLAPGDTRACNFSLANKTYVLALEDLVLQPLEKIGMDFWWIDWQQGENGGETPGGMLNPTILLNKIRSTDHKRRGEATRGLVLGRFGGLGNHRYQVGFSGDVAGLTWANLAFQPYFSMTSSNVAYGMWSHDLVGPGDDHELFVRWMQWGAVSAVTRMHDRGMAAGSCKDPFPSDSDDGSRCAQIEPWASPRRFFEAIREALLLRAELVPYLYTQSRVAFETGLPVLAPLYYLYPEEPMAYAASKDGSFAQFMLGESLMADELGLAESTVWIPPGSWLEIGRGGVHSAGGNLTKRYAIEELPLFVREGSVIPTAPRPSPGQTTGMAGRAADHLVFSIYSPVFPGGGARYYEDDGVSTNYCTADEFAWVEANYTTSRDLTQLTFSVSTAGSWPGMPTRRYRLNLVNFLPPQSVQLGGTSLPYSRTGGPLTWTYDGPSLTLTVDTPHIPAGSPVSIHVASLGAPAGARGLLDGARGVMAHAVLAKRALDQTWSTPGSATQSFKPEALSALASSGDALSYLAGTDRNAFLSALKRLRHMLKAAVKELHGPLGSAADGSSPRWSRAGAHIGFSDTPGVQGWSGVDPLRLRYALGLLDDV